MHQLSSAINQSFSNRLHFLIVTQLYIWWPCFEHTPWSILKRRQASCQPGGAKPAYGHSGVPVVYMVTGTLVILCIWASHVRHLRAQQCLQCPPLPMALVMDLPPSWACTKCIYFLPRTSQIKWWKWKKYIKVLSSEMDPAEIRLMFIKGRCAIGFLENSPPPRIESIRAPLVF